MKYPKYLLLIIHLFSSITGWTQQRIIPYEIGAKTF